MGSCFSKNPQIVTATTTTTTLPCRTACIICFQTANTVLYPCGHFCLCQECSERLSRQDTSQLRYFKLNFKERKGMKCPMCRRKGLPAIVYQNIEELT